MSTQPFGPTEFSGSPHPQRFKNFRNASLGNLQTTRKLIHEVEFENVFRSVSRDIGFQIRSFQRCVACRDF
jgi:hypothetical protein